MLTVANFGENAILVQEVRLREPNCFRFYHTFIPCLSLFDFGKSITGSSALIRNVLWT